MEWLPLSASDVANATAGRVVRGDPATAVGRVSIDSRSLEPGDFFVAIAGETLTGIDSWAMPLDVGPSA